MSTQEFKWECWARYVLENWRRERIEAFLRKRPASEKYLREKLNAAIREKKASATAPTGGNERDGSPLRARNTKTANAGR
jgi:hypothetical protein